MKRLVLIKLFQAAFFSGFEIGKIWSRIELIKVKKSGAIVLAVVIAGFLIAISILGVGYMNYRQKIEALNREEKIRTEKEQRLTRCKLEAQAYYQRWWASSCKDFGTNKPKDWTEGSSECSLPTYIADNINKKLTSDLENCVKLYSSN